MKKTIELSPQEVDLLVKLLQILTDNTPPSLRERVVETLTNWHTAHGERQMPLWKLNRTLGITRMEMFSILEALQEEGAVEFVHVPTKGRPSDGYRLTSNFLTSLGNK